MGVRLVGVDDGFQLWAKRFDCAAAEVLTVGDAAAQATAAALTVDIEAQPREPAADPAAMDLYLRGRHEYHRGWQASNDRAIDLFEHALRLTPDDPMILSSYAMALMHRFSRHEGADADAAGVKGRVAAERAVLLAPHLADPKVALATFYTNAGEHELAARELRHALAITSRHAEGNELFGRMLVEAGRIEEGALRLETAAKLEPRMAHSVAMELARVTALMGSECPPELGPMPKEDAELNQYWLTRWRLILWRRDVAAAERSLATLEQLEFTMKEPAKRILQQIVEKALDPIVVAVLRARAEGAGKRKRVFYLQQLAEAFAYVGDVEQAIECIDECTKAGMFDITWMRQCPLFSDLQREPRFAGMREIVQTRADGVLQQLLGW